MWIPDSKTRTCDIEVALETQDFQDARDMEYLVRKDSKQIVEPSQMNEACCIHPLPRCVPYNFILRPVVMTWILLH